jgi:glutamate-ammonia-ligase adenylyltransferase
MVALHPISTYSEDELTRFKSYSSISQHYFQLLQKNPANFSDELRIKKHEHWLECALATYFNKYTPDDVCFYWSRKTEDLIKEAWAHCQIPEDHVNLLAYGKLGSNELNLSSDIDIVFIKETQHTDSGLLVKIKKFIQILSENTPLGFAYRLDLDLRPGGSQAPLIPNKNHFYNFYDEYLEAWHRLSFVRARPLFDNQKLGQDVLSYCQKRAYPRRLDFSVIQNIKSVRSKIEFQWYKDHEPLDIKLHPGGIRDIELYIHSLQVIYGGRHRALRTSSFTKAISELKAVKALEKEEGDFLHSFYWHLRRIENLIHIQRDTHTYRLDPLTLRDVPSLNFSLTQFQSNLIKSEGLIKGFFAPINEVKRNKPPTTQGLLPVTQKAITDIQNLKSRSIKKQQVEDLKQEILNSFIAKVQEINIDENLSIQIFRDFVFAIQSKTSLFHLLARQKDLLENLAWLFSISPYAGQILTRRPELIDSFALGQIEFNKDDDIETLLENLIDYKFLGQLTSIIYLFRNKNIDHFIQQLSVQADVIVQTLLDHLSLTYDAEPLSILCLGKWGSCEMGLQSDLDFVFLSDSKPTQKQLKVARRTINLLTSPSNVGRIYSIDLRLKPHSGAGPLILETSSLFDFIQNQAQAWQKQAYLRSRLLGSSSFFLKDQFHLLKVKDKEKDELNEISSKLLTPPQEQSIDIKYNPGGIVHSELCVQKHALMQDTPPPLSSMDELVKLLPMSEEERILLIANYKKLRRVEQMLQISSDSSSTKVVKGSEISARAARMMNNKDLIEDLRNTLNDQHKRLKKLDLSH